MNYIMLITYSFDCEYFAIPCKTEEEAILMMDEYLNLEVYTVERESGYSPTVLINDETEKVICYTPLSVDHDDYHDYDYAVYKVIDVYHNTERK